ncbi:hypothetical protein [Rhodopirellula islandica]|nr:hypothetical protein [Rhodopirellula islandica]
MLKEPSPVKKIENALDIASDSFALVESQPASSATQKEVIADLRFAIGDHSTAASLLALGSLSTELRRYILQLARNTLAATPQNSQKRRRSGPISAGFSWTHVLKLGKLKHSKTRELNSARRMLLKKSVREGWSSAEFSRAITAWNAEQSDRPDTQKQIRPTQMITQVVQNTSSLTDLLTEFAAKARSSDAVRIKARDLDKAAEQCELAIEDLKALTKSAGEASKRIREIQSEVKRRLDPS